ncbi:MAG: response regulator [Desulfosalsimonadaceae bacterium]
MKDKATILVVDDQPQNIELLEAYLVPQGYETVRAASGEEALEKLSGNQIDLILLDVKMPGLDGFEVTRRVRQDNTHRLLPIILVTSLQETEDRIKGIEAGCDDFISKPFDKMELLARVRSLLKVKAYNDLMKNYRNEIESEVARRIEELEHVMERLQKDIIERKRAEEALQESEERFRQIAESSQEWIWEVNCEGLYTYSGGVVKKMLGYKPEEIVGKKHFYDFFPADKREQKKQEALKSFAKKRAFSKYVNSNMHKNGSTVIMETSGLPILDSTGNLLGYRGIDADITERKKAERSLILSEEKFRKAVLTNPDSMVITRLADGMFVLVNQSFLELSGYTEEAVIGKTALDINIWGNSEDRKKILERLSVEGSVKNVESRFRKKNGDVFSGLISASIIDLNGSPHVLTITRDLTERKQAEEEKASLEAQLQQAQKMEAIGTLAGGIAHDFNNILTAILGYTELVISDLPQGSDTRGNLEEVFKASLRAIDLVKQILVFSRQSETQLFPIRIHLIIKEALKLLRSSLPSTIEINQNIRALGTVLADLTQIHQIMMNLCTNASHAMSENGGELSVSLIQVDVPNDKSGPMDLPPGPYLKLTVSDTGCGMTPDVQNRIFEPYYTTKGIDKGTGLGLAVVHGIVQNHGGRITVESEPGNGSSFHVYLPEIMDSGEDKETIQAVAPDAMGTERILFVDDESTIVEMGKKMLERLGYEVAGSTSGAEALELFRAKPDQFDLVITDMTMPHMTGDQLSGKLIEIRPDIPIILCTGFSEKMTEEAAKEIGIREFIMKPISRQVLSKIIRNVLDAPESGYSLLNT